MVVIMLRYGGVREKGGIAQGGEAWCNIFFNYLNLGFCRCLGTEYNKHWLVLIAGNLFLNFASSP